VLDHRDRKPPREIGERCDCRRIAPGAGGDDERVLSRRENAGSLVDRTVVGADRSGGDAARRGIVGKAGQGGRQHFTRQ
jgi:hypothetical protein